MSIFNRLFGKSGEIEIDGKPEPRASDKFNPSPLYDGEYKPSLNEVTSDGDKFQGSTLGETMRYGKGKDLDFDGAAEKRAAHFAKIGRPGDGAHYTGIDNIDPDIYHVGSTTVSVESYTKRALKAFFTKSGGLLSYFKGGVNEADIHEAVIGIAREDRLGPAKNELVGDLIEGVEKEVERALNKEDFLGYEPEEEKGNWFQRRFAKRTNEYQKAKGDRLPSSPMSRQQQILNARGGRITHVIPSHMRRKKPPLSKEAIKFRNENGIK